MPASTVRHAFLVPRLADTMTDPFPARLPLSRAQIDRDHQGRLDEDLLARIWLDDAARVLPLFNGDALLAGPGRLRLLPPSAVPSAEQLVYLGRLLADSPDGPAGSRVVAAAVSEDTARVLGNEWVGLRAIGHLLDDRDAGLFTEALAMLNWHAAHGFSPRTGRPTRSIMGGWVRVDPESRTEVFPRTDPAVIVAVTDSQDRLLLGSNALWETNRYSLLAGFVEPGESLEQAAIREVQEESGVPILDPVYRGSQPWPFPASLMVGFTARVEPSFAGRAEPDGEEILDLRWFSRQGLADALPDLLLPGPTSIARRLIEDWWGSPLPDRGKR